LAHAIIEYGVTLILGREAIVVVIWGMLVKEVGPLGSLYHLPVFLSLTRMV
jgi:hypothetical protein